MNRVDGWKWLAVRRVAARWGVAALFCVLGGVVMGQEAAPQADASPAESDASHGSRWAIAIHGGAGGNPAEWSDAQRAARLDGMRAALNVGTKLLREGGTALDTVEAVIRVLEDDRAFNAGRGAVLSRAGRAELDASIMDGRQRGCGAVGGVTVVRHPITLARRVMTETKHVLVAGPGADAFGREQGVEIVSPEYFLLKPQERDLSVSWRSPGTYFGTVGCAVLDRHGNLAAGTSTGGLSGKMPGRLGDSPIVGAGTYADNATCAISATGTGEEFMRHAITYDVSAQMRYLGRSVEEAVNVAMTERLAPNTGGLIAVGHDGTITMQHNTPGMTCAAADSDGQLSVQLAVE